MPPCAILLFFHASTIRILATDYKHVEKAESNKATTPQKKELYSALLRLFGVKMTLARIKSSGLRIGHKDARFRIQEFGILHLCVKSATSDPERSSVFDRLT